MSVPREPAETTGAHPGDDDIVVERHVDLADVGHERAWELIATPAGWAEWFVDDADVVIAPGERGTVGRDGVRTPVEIGTVDPGVVVRFGWTGGEVEFALTGPAAVPVIRIVERRRTPAVSTLTATAANFALAA